MTQRQTQNTNKAGYKKVVASVLALASLVLFLGMIFQDFGGLANADWSTLPINLIVRYAVAMVLGGALAGYILARMFGTSGILGWLLALIGGFLVSTFAGIIGSAFGLAPDLLSDGFQTSDVLAIAAGALVLPLAVIGWPVLLPIWLVFVALAQVLAGRQRQGFPNTETHLR